MAKVENMKAVTAFVAVITTLILANPAIGEPLKVTENLRHELVVLPVSTPDRASLRLVDTSMFIDEESGVGILFFYDDARTKWEVDYIELYNTEGDLLLVSWLDAFGVCQAALDRGLLDPDQPRVDRALLTIGLGTMF